MLAVATMECAVTEKSIGVVGTVVATIIGAAIIGLGSALFAYLAPGNEAAVEIVGAVKTAGSGIARAAAAVWRFVNAPVPLWAFAALAVLCVRLWTRRAKAPEPIKVDAIGRSLIEVLGTADGNAVHIDIVANTLDWPRIQVETVANDLAAVDLVNGYHNYSGLALELTGPGKRFALAERLTGTEALRERLQRATRLQSGRI